MMELPALTDLIVSGGDERLALDPSTGRNMYGHGARPDPDELAFGSSTASTISGPAYDMLETMHRTLADDVSRRGGVRVYEEEAARLRQDLQAIIGARGASAPEIILTPSGTDAHLLAALLFNRRDGRPLQTITLPGSETGSSVAAAAAGRRFMTLAPSGASSARGEAVGQGEDVSNVTITVRDRFGRIRCDADVEADLDAMIVAAARNGRRSLLVVADVSKTGLIAPSLACAFRLRERHRDDLDLVVDACQLRLSPAAIRAYLATGLAVAITGSKFLGGPVFSGALLLPRELACELRFRQVPPALADHSSACDWPDEFAARSSLPPRPNFGLLLRWRASLFEWQTLLAQPEERVSHAIRTFGEAMAVRLREDPAFAPVRCRTLDRSALGSAAAEFSTLDCLPTILPFHLSGPSRDLLTPAETSAVHDALRRGAHASRPVRLGQPVACGERRGAPAAALRLCLDARLIVAACADDSACKRLVAAGHEALDAAAAMAALVRRSPRAAA